MAHPDLYGWIPTVAGASTSSSVADSCATRLLCDAAREGDAARLKQLIDDGGDISERAPSGSTPLHFASASLSEDVECTRLLLEARCEVDVTDNYGRTPLHKAAMRGAFQRVELLLAAGADCMAPCAAAATAKRCGGSSTSDSLESR